MLGQAEVRRDLAEADRPRAARGVARDLGDREVDVPQRDEAQRDQVTVGVAAPVVDHPVVVRAHALQPELEVVALHERLAAEAWERREGERAVDAGEREVVDARLRARSSPGRISSYVIAAMYIFAAVEAADVAVGRRVERDRDVPLVHVDEAVLVDPVVAPAAVVGHLLLVGRARRRARSRPTAPARRAAPARASAPGAAPARGGRARRRGRRR